MSTDQRSKDWYNQHAERYTQHVRNPKESIYHSLYEKPAMYSLLPGLKGKSVISIGCGSGEDCKYLKSLGAERVVGIDISEKLIEIAKQSYPDCEFYVMDMEKLNFIDASFDFAYSSLAIHYIEDWHKVLAEVYRILKPYSYFLFSCDHPVSSSMDVISDDGVIKTSQLQRVKDRSNNTVKITGDYLSRRAIKLDGDDKMAVTTWQKSIGEISREVADTNFVIANIIEPVPLLKMKDISQADYDTLIKIPSFIIFKLQKL
jgi:ubiquinone/menaquinone biosynthesis C-methylase UbiE